MGFIAVHGRQPEKLSQPAVEEANHVVRLWDVTSRRQVGELGRDLFIVRALAFSSPNGRLLLTGSANNAPVARVRDGSCLRIWDIRRRKEVARLGVHASSVHSAAFSKDGRLAACGSSGQFMPGRNTGAEEVFCPQTIRFWDITSRFWALRAAERSAEVMEHTAWVNSIKLSPDGKLIFTAGRGCFLWEVASGQMVLQFQVGEFDYANCGDLSPDGRYVATGSGGRGRTRGTVPRLFRSYLRHGDGLRDCAVRTRVRGNRTRILSEGRNPRCWWSPRRTTYLETARFRKRFSLLTKHIASATFKSGPEMRAPTPPSAASAPPS